jgi:hypothetical protein
VIVTNSSEEKEKDDSVPPGRPRQRGNENFSRAEREWIERLEAKADAVRQSELAARERFERVRKAVRQLSRYQSITQLWLRKSMEAPEVRLAKPPGLLFGSIARLLLKPPAYKRYVEPAIADMHEEYFACLARGDKRGARWAVIRGNLYAVPAWLWGVVAQLVLKLIG